MLLGEHVSGVGIDSVNIVRFTEFAQYSDTKLSRLFSRQEIAYCRKVPTLSAQRFAVTFAAKEAFYKALCARSDLFACRVLPFLKVCSLVSVARDMRAPYFVWSTCSVASIGFVCQCTRLSLSHDCDYAHAFVVIV